MKTNTLRIARLGFGLVAALATTIPAVSAPAVSASANERYPIIFAYVVSVNPSAYTITATDESQRRLVFPVSKNTFFTDVNGLVLVKGRTVDGANVLKVASDKGYFDKGARLRVTCDATGDEIVVDQVMFWDVDKNKERDDRDAAEAEAAKKNREKK